LRATTKQKRKAKRKMFEHILEESFERNNDNDIEQEIESKSNKNNLMCMFELPQRNRIGKRKTKRIKNKINRIPDLND